METISNEEFERVINKRLEKRFRPKTRYEYKDIMDRFQRFIRPKLLSEASSRDVMEYISALDYADRTVRKHYYALRSIYGSALAYGLIDKDPSLAAEDCISWRQIRPARPTKYIPPDQMRNIIELRKISREPERDQAIIDVLAGVGLRRSELTQLKLQDVRSSQAGNMVVEIKEPKGGKNRVHVIPEWAWESFSVVIAKRVEEGAKPEDYIFVSRLKRKAGKPLNDHTIRNICQKHAGLSPHAFRASMATELYLNGASWEEIAQALGHRDPTSCKHYVMQFLDPDTMPTVNYKRKVGNG